MALSLDNISGPGSLKQNVGGTTGRIRFAPIPEFSVIEKKLEMSDPSASNNIDLIEISGDHTFPVGKGFYEMYITRDTGKVVSKPNSERDTTGHTATFEGMTPGADSKTEAILLLAENNKLICMIELADGKWLQLGSERFPAEMKHEWSSESNEKGERGWKVLITAFDTSKAYYTGVFTMYP
jgi:hypothetical protein